MIIRGIALLWALIFFASCGRNKPVISELFPVKAGKVYGYIDRSGKSVIGPQFSKASCFTDGIALVATGDTNLRWGYIDQAGNYTIPATYTGATTFSEGVAFTTTPDGVPTAITKGGTVLFSLDTAVMAQNFSNGLAAYCILSPEGDLWGFVDKQGKTIIAPAYRQVNYFTEELCSVMNEKGQWGFINPKGETAIAFRYGNAYPFEGKYARVSIGDKWGIIDKHGNEVIKPQYASIDVDGDRYLVKQGDKWGWINKTGNASIPLQYSNAFPFKGNGYAAVSVGNKWGYINEAGKEIIPPRYDFAFGFDGDLALVQEGSKYGFINKDGSFVINPSFDNVALDYFTRFFAHIPAYYSVTTNKNTPGIVGWKWLNHFYHMEYSEAMKFSTNETRVMLTSFADVTGMIADSSKQHMAGLIVGIKNARVDNNRAIVTYSLSDNPGKEQLLFLVKEESKWLVLFTKNDSIGKMASGNN